MKKLFSLLLCTVLVLSFLTGALTSCNATAEKEAKYTAALVLTANGDYEAAYAAFRELGDYKDAQKHLSRFLYIPTVVEYELHDRSGTMTVTLGAGNLPCRTVSEGTVGRKEGLCIYDSKGNMLKQQMIFDGMLASYDYTYDANSNMIKAEYSENGTVTKVQDFTYNENGLKTGEVFTVNGEINYDAKNYYDEKGNLIKCDFDTPDVDYFYTYTYDAKGNRTQEHTDLSTGEWYTVDYTYDGNGRLTQSRYVDDDDYRYTTDYTYDAAGNCIREAVTHGDGSQDVTVWEYDAHGNVTKREFTAADGVKETVKTQYVFTYLLVDMHPASVEHMLFVLEV